MNTRLITAALMAALLTACSTLPPQAAVGASSEMLANKSTKIAVVMAPMPKVDTEFPGAGCLLCMAAASVTNKSLTNYVQTLTAEDLDRLPAEITKALRARGIEATQIKEPLDVKKLPDAGAPKPNFARKDFSTLKAKYGVDKLVVIEIDAVGVWRNYANYVPAGDPRAIVKGRGYVVDLTTNALEWFAPVDVARNANGPWDDGAAFPRLTNAYYQAIEASRDSLKQPFLQAQP